MTADDWREWRSLRLRALAEAPDAFGSTLAEWSGAGDTEQRWRDRLDAVPVNLLADDDGGPVGMASVTAVTGREAELISMWVAPSARGTGVGIALVVRAMEQAAALGAERLALDVAEGNDRAIGLYRRAGFTDAGWATAPESERPERRMHRALPITSPGLSG